MMDDHEQRENRINFSLCLRFLKNIGRHVFLISERLLNLSIDLFFKICKKKTTCGSNKSPIQYIPSHELLFPKENKNFLAPLFITMWSGFIKTYLFTKKKPELVLSFWPRSTSLSSSCENARRLKRLYYANLPRGMSCINRQSQGKKNRSWRQQHADPTVIYYPIIKLGDFFFGYFTRSTLLELPCYFIFLKRLPRKENASRVCL